MDATLTAHGTPRPVLTALREVLDGADEALICSAFVDTRGVQLIGRELGHLGPRGRLLATAAFSGDRARRAMALAGESGTRGRIFNPPRGTFHPKVTVARHGGEHVALVGSANLTSGLVVNVEAGVVLTGTDVTEVLDLAETWWGLSGRPGLPGLDTVDVFEDELWALLRDAVPVGATVMTLGRSPRTNRVVAIDRTGLLVETDASQAKGIGPQPVPPRMVQLAWDVLTTTGTLSNRLLLEELRVHRSSFVCALLARLPGVTVTARAPITLSFVGPATAVAAERGVEPYA